MIYKDFKNIFTALGGVVAFCFLFGSSLVNFLENNHIISFAQDGRITIVPFANLIWYILGLLILVIIALCFMGYKYIFCGLRFGTWPYLLMWLAYVLCIAFALAKPVPWYGLTLGLFGLYFLFWFLYRVIFPYDFKQSKA